MTKRLEVPVARLRELFTYDAATGELTNRVKRAANAMPGKRSGAETIGTRLVGVDDLRLKEHRVIWALHYGSWPQGVIDHINGNPHDNRIVNLREGTQAQNCKNTNQPLGATGVRGVTKHGRRYRAAISHNRRRVIVGSFETVEEASAAYQEAASAAYGEFAFHRSRNVR